MRVCTCLQVTRAFYYTMSSEGVTFFQDRDTTHYSLDDFERNFLLHQQLVQLPFFSRYRLWKPFRLWRAALLRKKSLHAVDSMHKNLFVLDPVFRPCLLAVQERCCRVLEDVSLTPIQPGAAFTLQAFQVCLVVGY